MVSVHLDRRSFGNSRCRRSRSSEGFALIRLLIGGICNTDLELRRGYYGFSGTPGHEFVGEVVEADSAHLSASGWSARSILRADIVRGAAAGLGAIVRTGRCSAS